MQAARPVPSQPAAVVFETADDMDAAFAPFRKGAGDAATASANIAALGVLLQGDAPANVKREAMGYLSTYACHPAIIAMSGGETTRQACNILHDLLGEESLKVLDMNPLRVINNMALDRELVGFMPSGLVAVSTLMEITSMRPLPRDIGEDSAKRTKYLDAEVRRTCRADQYKVEMASVWARANEKAADERETLAAIAATSASPFFRHLGSAFRLEPVA